MPINVPTLSKMNIHHFFEINLLKIRKIENQFTFIKSFFIFYEYFLDYVINNIGKKYIELPAFNAISIPYILCIHSFSRLYNESSSISSTIKDL